LRRQHEVDHPAQINRLQVIHRSEMRRLQADHDQKISDMTREYQDAEEVLEHKVVKLVEKEEEAERCHQRQLRDLEQDRQIQLQKMKEMSEKHHAAEDRHKAEIVEMIEELKSVEHHYKEKLNNLQLAHAAAMAGIQAHHQVEQLAIAKAHQKEISTYETKIQSQTFKFEKNIDATLVRHEAEIHAIKHGHYSEVARLREDRRNFEEVQEKEHAERLSAMTKQHDAEKSVTVRKIRAMEEQHGLEVAKMRQDMRDSERSHESEMSAMKAAHEKQLFKVHSLLTKECYKNGLVDTPRSPDRFPVQIEVEVKNKTLVTGPPQFLPPMSFRQLEPSLTTESESSLNDLQARRGPGTGVYPPEFNKYEDGRRSARSQPSPREIGDKVEAAMLPWNERSPDRRISPRTTARTHRGDEMKAVEDMPRSVFPPLAPKQPLERKRKPSRGNSKSFFGAFWKEPTQGRDLASSTL
jgi:hypothetical protein